MVFSTCFNGYDAGIMTVILANKQFISYYGINDAKSGLVAVIPWAMTGRILYQQHSSFFFLFFN